MQQSGNNILVVCANNYYYTFPCFYNISQFHHYHFRLRPIFGKSTKEDIFCTIFPLDHLTKANKNYHISKSVVGPLQIRCKSVPYNYRINGLGTDLERRWNEGRTLLSRSYIFIRIKLGNVKIWRFAFLHRLLRYIILHSTFIWVIVGIVIAFLKRIE